MNELQRKILAILFASGDPIGGDRLAEALDITLEDVDKLLLTLSDWLSDLDMPFEILYLGGQYQLATRRELAPIISAALDTRRAAPLTQASLEVLAIIAYNQPVTRAFIEQVRGVDSSSIVANLTQKGFIEEVDRLDIPGRPIAFGTTPLFLRTFGISDLSELPDPHSFSAQPMPDEDTADAHMPQDPDQMDLEL
jgi:segregation and condensation protein B